MELCRIMTEVGVSIKDIMHERAWLNDVYSVSVKVVCETRDWSHSEELRKALTRKYTRVTFWDTPLAIANKY